MLALLRIYFTGVLWGTQHPTGAGVTVTTVMGKQADFFIKL